MRSGIATKQRAPGLRELLFKEIARNSDSDEARAKTYAYATSFGLTYVAESLACIGLQGSA